MFCDPITDKHFEIYNSNRIFLHVLIDENLSGFKINLQLKNFKRIQILNFLRFYIECKSVADIFCICNETNIFIKIFSNLSL